MTAAVLEAPLVPMVQFRSRHPLLVQLARYTAVSGLATMVNAGAFLLVRVWWDAIPSVLAALVLSTLVSTEVNRRFTFSTASTHPWREHLVTVGTVAFYACYSSFVLLVVAAVVDDPTPLLESAVVTAASVLAGVGRFVLLRQWVFEPVPVRSWPMVPAHRYRTA